MTSKYIQTVCGLIDRATTCMCGGNITEEEYKLLMGFVEELEITIKTCRTAGKGKENE